MGRDPGAGARLVDRDLAARLPAGRRRRRRRASRARPPSRSSSPGCIGSPVNPGITTARRSSSRAPTRAGRTAPTSYQPFIGCIPSGGGGPRTPMAFTRSERDQAGRADHGARRGRSRSRRARSRARRSRCQPGERLLGSTPQRRPLHRGRADARAARRRARVVVRRGRADPRQRDAPRPRRRACAPRCRCRRSARGEARLAARAARAPARAARGARLPRARAPARALCDPLHEHRGAGLGRGAASRRWRALVPPAARAARADLRDSPRSRGPRCRSPSPASRRRSRSPSTCRARCRPTTSSRRGSAPRRRRSGASSTAVPEQVPRRPRDVLVRAVRRGAADARPQARAAGRSRTARRSARARRSATRSRARSSCSQPGRPTTGAPPPAGGRRRRRRGDPDAPLSAILLLSDGAQTRGTLAPLEGAARAKSYGIPVYTVALGTPDGVLNRGGFARPVPPDPATLRQIAQTTGGEFFATQSQARLNAVYEDLASRLGQQERVARAELRPASALAALLALAAGALSLLWVQRLP